MNEKILCAATWYMDLKPVKNLPTYTYLPNNLDKGLVFCAHRHGQCLNVKGAVTGLRDAESGKYIQGFLTSKNRFVDREEALQIALKENQVLNIHNIRGNRLYSEDLY